MRNHKVDSSVRFAVEPLYTTDGKYVATIEIAPWVWPPEVILWEGRAFVRDGQGYYREGFAWNAVLPHVPSHRVYDNDDIPRFAHRRPDALAHLEAKIEALIHLLHHAGELERSRNSIGVTLLIDRRSEPVDPITLPEHKTFSDRKTRVLYAPTYLDINDTTDGPDGTVKPDPDAVVTLTSSDDSQAGVEITGEGSFITTPLDNGAANITFSATSPNATYPDVVLPFSYRKVVAGQLNVSVGADVPDA